MCIITEKCNESVIRYEIQQCFLYSLYHPNRNLIFCSRFISENLLPMYFFLSSSVYYYYLKTENKEITQCQKICFYMWLQKPFWCYFAFVCLNIYIIQYFFFLVLFVLYFLEYGDGECCLVCLWIYYYECAPHTLFWNIYPFKKYDTYTVHICIE